MKPEKNKTLTAGSGFFRRLFLAAFGMALLLTLSGQMVRAADYPFDENYLCAEENGHQALLDDGAGLFTSEEKDELFDKLKSGLEQGNMVLVTTDEAGNNTAESLANTYYRNFYGQEDGAVFLIDMDNRMLWIKGFGTCGKTLTSSQANVITDNIYRSASAGA